MTEVTPRFVFSADISSYFDEEFLSIRPDLIKICPDYKKIPRFRDVLLTKSCLIFAS